MWQAKAGAQAAKRTFGQAKVSAMGPRGVAGQRQTEADAGRILRARLVQPGEGAEGVLVLFLRDAGAIIVDMDFSCVRAVHSSTG